MKKPDWSAWREAWAQRSARERRVLLLGGILLALLLLAQWLWSAHHGRRALRERLPQQAQQLAEIKAAAQEWQRLAALPRRPPPLLGEAARRQLAGGAQALGLTADWREGGRLALRGRCAFDDWLRWLETVRRDHGLIVTQAQVGKLAPGIVTVDAVLALPEG